jgi:hypothetical protein
VPLAGRVEWALAAHKALRARSCQGQARQGWARQVAAQAEPASARPGAHSALLPLLAEARMEEYTALPQSLQRRRLWRLGHKQHTSSSSSRRTWCHRPRQAWHLRSDTASELEAQREV